MIIKKYLAKTEKDAIEKAKEELGSSAIVMNVKKVHPRGLLRIFLRSKVEVTAALDENISYSEDVHARERAATEKSAGSVNTSEKRGSGFDVTIPPLDELPPIDKKPENLSVTSDMKEKQSNEERLSVLFSLLEKQMEETNLSSSQQQKTTQEHRREPVRSESGRSTRTEPHEDKHPVSEPHVVPPVKKTESKAEEPESEEEKDKGAVYRDLIYKQLIANEVDEAIAERILDEAKRSLPKDAAVNQILASVYQRIILMIGQPYLINYKPNEATKFVFFLGSTGVGKTTTIAKIAARMQMEKNCNIALVTADTYRVAAAKQLRAFADVLSFPLHVIYEPEEMGRLVEELEKYDVVLIDTAGCSHKNKEQIENVRVLLDQVPISKRLVYLVLNTGTKYKDLKEIAGVYAGITDYSIIFTKLDETSSIGVILNMRDSTKCPISYVTNGQDVPEDIAVVDAQAIAKQLLS